MNSDTEVSESGTGKDPEASNTPICYGDTVLIRLSGTNQAVASGVEEYDVPQCIDVTRLHNSGHLWMACFVIVPELVHSAKRRMSAFMEEHNLRSNNLGLQAVPEAIRDSYRALKQGIEHEEVRNKSTMKSSMGKPVPIGSSVRLMHQASGILLTCSPLDAPRLLPVAQTIVLSSDWGSGTEFNFSPLQSRTASNFVQAQVDFHIFLSGTQTLLSTKVQEKQVAFNGDTQWSERSTQLEDGMGCFCVKQSHAVQSSWFITILKRWGKGDSLEIGQPTTKGLSSVHDEGLQSQSRAPSNRGIHFGQVGSIDTAMGMRLYLPPGGSVPILLEPSQRSSGVGWNSEGSPWALWRLESPSLSMGLIQDDSKSEMCHCIIRHVITGRCLVFSSLSPAFSSAATLNDVFAVSTIPEYDEQALLNKEQNDNAIEPEVPDNDQSFKCVLIDVHGSRQFSVRGLDSSSCFISRLPEGIHAEMIPDREDVPETIPGHKTAEAVTASANLVANLVQDSLEQALEAMAFQKAEEMEVQEDLKAAAAKSNKLQPVAPQQGGIQSLVSEGLSGLLSGGLGIVSSAGQIISNIEDGAEEAIQGSSLANVASQIEQYSANLNAAAASASSIIAKGAADVVSELADVSILGSNDMEQFAHIPGGLKANVILATGCTSAQLVFELNKPAEIRERHLHSFQDYVTKLDFFRWTLCCAIGASKCPHPSKTPSYNPSDANSGVMQAAENEEAEKLSSTTDANGILDTINSAMPVLPDAMVNLSVSASKDHQEPQTQPPMWLDQANECIHALESLQSLCDSEGKIGIMLSLGTTHVLADIISLLSVVATGASLPEDHPARYSVNPVSHKSQFQTVLEWAKHLSSVCAMSSLPNVLTRWLQSTPNRWQSLSDMASTKGRPLVRRLISTIANFVILCLEHSPLSRMACTPLFHSLLLCVPSNPSCAVAVQKLFDADQEFLSVWGPAVVDMGRSRLSHIFSSMQLSGEGSFHSPDVHESGKPDTALSSSATNHSENVSRNCWHGEPAFWLHMLSIVTYPQGRVAPTVLQSVFHKIFLPDSVQEGNVLLEFKCHQKTLSIRRPMDRNADASAIANQPSVRSWVLSGGAVATNRTPEECWLDLQALAISASVVRQQPSNSTTIPPVQVLKMATATLELFCAVCGNVPLDGSIRWQRVIQEVQSRCGLSFLIQAVGSLSLPVEFCTAACRLLRVCWLWSPLSQVSNSDVVSWKSEVIIQSSFVSGLSKQDKQELAAMLISCSVRIAESADSISPAWSLEVIKLTQTAIDLRIMKPQQIAQISHALNGVISRPSLSTGQIPSSVYMCIHNALPNLSNSHVAAVARCFRRKQVLKGELVTSGNGDEEDVVCAVVETGQLVLVLLDESTRGAAVLGSIDAGQMFNANNLTKASKIWNKSSEHSNINWKSFKCRCSNNGVMWYARRKEVERALWQGPIRLSRSSRFVSSLFEVQIAATRLSGRLLDGGVQNSPVDAVRLLRTERAVRSNTLNSSESLDRNPDFTAEDQEDSSIPETINANGAILANWLVSLRRSTAIPTTACCMNLRSFVLMSCIIHLIIAIGLCILSGLDYLFDDGISRSIAPPGQGSSLAMIAIACSWFLIGILSTVCVIFKLGIGLAIASCLEGLVFVMLTVLQIVTMFSLGTQAEHPIIRSLALVCFSVYELSHLWYISSLALAHLPLPTFEQYSDAEAASLELQEKANAEAREAEALSMVATKPILSKYNWLRPSAASSLDHHSILKLIAAQNSALRATALKVSLQVGMQPERILSRLQHTVLLCSEADDEFAEQAVGAIERLCHNVLSAWSLLFDISDSWPPILRASNAQRMTLGRSIADIGACFLTLQTLAVNSSGDATGDKTRRLTMSVAQIRDVFLSCDLSEVIGMCLQLVSTISKGLSSNSQASIDSTFGPKVIEAVDCTFKMLSWCCVDHSEWQLKAAQILCNVDPGVYNECSFRFCEAVAESCRANHLAQRKHGIPLLSKLLHMLQPHSSLTFGQSDKMVSAICRSISIVVCGSTRLSGVEAWIQDDLPLNCLVTLVHVAYKDLPRIRIANIDGLVGKAVQEGDGDVAEIGSEGEDDGEYSVSDTESAAIHNQTAEQILKGAPSIREEGMTIPPRAQNPSSATLRWWEAASESVCVELMHAISALQECAQKSSTGKLTSILSPSNLGAAICDTCCPPNIRAACIRLMANVYLPIISKGDISHWKEQSMPVWVMTDSLARAVLLPQNRGELVLASLEFWLPGMLRVCKEVFPKINRLHPDIKVLLGGFLESTLKSIILVFDSTVNSHSQVMIHRCSKFIGDAQRVIKVFESYDISVQQWLSDEFEKISSHKSIAIANQIKHRGYMTSRALAASEQRGGVAADILSHWRNFVRSQKPGGSNPGHIMAQSILRLVPSAMSSNCLAETIMCRLCESVVPGGCVWGSEKEESWNLWNEAVGVIRIILEQCSGEGASSPSPDGQISAGNVAPRWMRQSILQAVVSLTAGAASAEGRLNQAEGGLLLGIYLLQHHGESTRLGLTEYARNCPEDGFFNGLNAIIDDAMAAALIISRVYARAMKQTLSLAGTELNKNASGQQVTVDPQSLWQQIDGASATASLTGSVSVRLGRGMVALRFIQLLCEGHCSEAQDMLISRDSNVPTAQSNVMLHVVMLLRACMRQPHRVLVPTAIVALEALTESLQSPCRKQQIQLSHSLLPGMLGRLLTSGISDPYAKYFSGSAPPPLLHLEDEVASAIFSSNGSAVAQLRSAGINALLALLESSPPVSVVRTIGTAIDLQKFAHAMVKIAEFEADMTTDPSREGQEAALTAMDQSESIGILYAVLLKSLEFVMEAPVRAAMKIVNNSDHARALIEGVTSIEVSRGDRLEEVVFPTPQQAIGVSSESIRNLLEQSDCEQHAESLAALLKQSNLLLEEKRQVQLIDQHPLLWPLTRLSRPIDYLFILSISVACIAILVDIRYPSKHFDDMQSISQMTATPAVQTLLLICAVVATMTQFLRLTWHVVGPGYHKVLTLFHADEDYHKVLLEEPGGPRYWLIYLRLSAGDNSLIVHFIIFVLSLLSVSFDSVASRIFLGFGLVDFLARSQTLRNVMRAVSLRGGTLVQTAVLMLTIVYIFGVVGFVFFGDLLLFDEPEIVAGSESDDNINGAACDSIWKCFLVVLDMGLRKGDIGAGLDDVGWETRGRVLLRIAYTTLFFIIIATILLNIVFGIIVDSFSELRSENEETEERLNGMCFICGNSRAILQRQARGGFDRHISQVHSARSYVEFLIHLSTKNSCDFTGPESYVFNRVFELDMYGKLKVKKIPDTTWLPYMTSRDLKNLAKAGNALNEEMSTSEARAMIRQADAQKFLDRAQQWLESISARLGSDMFS